MLEVTTKDELKKALSKHNDEIHVANDELSTELVTRPQKFRFIRKIMYGFGYRLITQSRLGRFDARFVKIEQSASRITD